MKRGPSSGAVLEHFWWGSVFLITLPLAGWRSCWPSSSYRATSTRRPIRSTTSAASSRWCWSAALILAINFAPVPEQGHARARAGGDRARRADRLLHPPASGEEPALRPRGRRATHVLGRRLRGDHRLRLADGRDVRRPAVPAERARLLDARGRGRDPAGRGVHGAWSRRGRRSSSRPTAPGSRCCCGYVFCLLGFLTMLLLWKEDISYWKVGLGYALIGIGVGFAGTPASHSLTGSVPVERAGMASGTADLQRDLGGAIMQSIMGALLTAGYAAAAGAAIAGSNKQVTDSVAEPADEVLRRRRERCAAVPAVREPDHEPRRRRRSCTATSGPTPPGSSRSCSVRRSCSSSSRRRRKRSSCSRSTTPRTAQAASTSASTTLPG